MVTLAGLMLFFGGVIDQIGCCCRHALCVGVGATRPSERAEVCMRLLHVHVPCVGVACQCQGAVIVEAQRQLLWGQDALLFVGLALVKLCRGLLAKFGGGEVATEAHKLWCIEAPR